MDAATAINITSGVALFAIGVFLLVQGTKARGGPILAAFLAIWAANVVLLNLATTDDPIWEPRLGLAGLACFIPLPFLILSFVCRFPPRMATRLPIVAAVFGLIVAAWFALEPGRFKEANDLNTAWGAALIFAPYQLSLAGALLIALRRWRTETSARLALEGEIVIFALLTFMGYLAGHWAPEQVRLAIEEPSAEWYVLSVSYLALSLAIAIALGILVRERARPAARRLLAAGLVGLIAGLALRLIFWRFELFEPFTTPVPGLIRLAAAALISYAILKHQVFDIDLRIKRGIPPSFLAGIPVVGFFVAAQLVETIVESRTSSTLIAIAVALGLFALEARVVRAGRRLSERLLPHVSPTPDYLASRRVEIYRAAVESARADGQITEGERRVLATLRQDLGIRDEEAEAV